MQQVRVYGPLLEHLGGWYPWRLERMSTQEVRARLAFAKDYERQMSRNYEEVEHG
ncbi:hypothetical protein [Nocardioides stalactiti]|uniref:hypothetical protein n=1 Tax=Nocardioides stalactiti TaxID=2755356 RepID=UPI0015FEE908|nr:hypothetical protein [Nocardioides stalactiti]